MMSDYILRNNRIEDIRWLCSLSESELDMLVSLKQMAMRRSKVIGHAFLARKFDLKLLRALSFILMENLKGELIATTSIPGLTECPNILDKCKLLSSKVDDKFSNMSIEELSAYVGASKSRRIADIFGEGVKSFKKTKHEK